MSSFVVASCGPSALEGSFNVVDYNTKERVKTPIDQNAPALDIRMKSFAQSTIKGAEFYEVELESMTDVDRAIIFSWESEPMDVEKWTWLEGIHRSEAIDSSRNYVSQNGDFHPLSFNNPHVGSCNNPLGRYPFAAITNGEKGIGIGIDMSEPAIFRAGFDGTEGKLYLACDLGFVKEKNNAKIRFCTFEFDPEWGFRGALQRYYELYPEAFASALPKDQQGIWMPFVSIADVKDYEDFGFKFHEAAFGREESFAAKTDDARDVLTFQYIEPGTGWLKFDLSMLPPKGNMANWTYFRFVKEQVWELIDELIAAGGGDDLKRLKNSVYHYEDGFPDYGVCDVPWCHGCVFGQNSMPGVKGEYTDFKYKWNDEFKDRIFGHPDSTGVWDGIYIDSSEGFQTFLNYRREHLGIAETNLTFGRGGKPAIFRGMSHFEFIRCVAEEMRAQGKFMMCNQNPSEMCFLSPLFDVLGTETDWFPKQQWTPMPVEHMFYRRALCCQKPYCFLQNTRFELFPKEYMEKYMKRSIAYGFSPSCFSHNAANDQYFAAASSYERDRDLFKKYVPICNEICEAGWEPIPYARASDECIQLERFGDDYLTVLNDSRSEKTFVVTLSQRKNCKAIDMVTGKEYAWKDGKAEFTLDGDDIFVFHFMN